MPSYQINSTTLNASGKYVMSGTINPFSIPVGCSPPVVNTFTATQQ